jgi:hypothetical protein
MERRPESSFSEGRKPERRSGTFPDIGVTNTPPSNRILSLCVAEHIFFK